VGDAAFCVISTARISSKKNFERPTILASKPPGSASRKASHGERLETITTARPSRVRCRGNSERNRRVTFKPSAPPSKAALSGPRTRSSGAVGK